MSTQPLPQAAVKMSSVGMMNITRDTREPIALTKTIELAAEEVNKRAKTLRDRFSIVIKDGTLLVGDYTNGYVYVERKTVLDFIASIKDGRFNRMLENLASHPVPLVILVTGSFGDIDQIEQKSYSTMCAKFENLGISVYYFPTSFILYHNMIRIFQFNLSTKKIEYHIEHPHGGLFLDVSKEVTAKMLFGIPGLEESKVEKLASKYSVEELFGMSLIDLTREMYEGAKQPPKKPSKSAYKIYLALRGKYGNYKEEGEPDTETKNDGDAISETSEAEEEIEKGDDENVDYMKLLGKETEIEELPQKSPSKVKRNKNEFLPTEEE